ncbi:hypothetical protein [Helicobacter sp. T3_23-1059]
MAKYDKNLKKSLLHLAMTKTISYHKNDADFSDDDIFFIIA